MGPLNIYGSFSSGTTEVIRVKVELVTGNPSEDKVLADFTIENVSGVEELGTYVASGTLTMPDGRVQGFHCPQVRHHRSRDVLSLLGRVLEFGVYKEQ